MRMVNVNGIEEELAFAKKAAERFKADPKLITFSNNGPTPGEYMALRWGMGDDCVVVVKLDEYHVPTNYQNLVR